VAVARDRRLQRTLFDGGFAGICFPKDYGGLGLTPAHQAAIAGGLAHLAALPQINLDGDRAVVTSYLQILTPHPTAEPHEVPNHGVSKGFRIHRVAANCWELERTTAGWKIRRRTVRTIDGSEPPREILRGALQSYEGR